MNKPEQDTVEIKPKKVFVEIYSGHAIKDKKIKKGKNKVLKSLYIELISEYGFISFIKEIEE